MEIKGLCASPPKELTADFITEESGGDGRGYSSAPGGAHPGIRCQPDPSFGILPETRAGSFCPKSSLILALQKFLVRLLKLPPHKGAGERPQPAEAKCRSVCRCSLVGSGFPNFLPQGFCNAAPPKAELPCATERDLRVHCSPCPGSGPDPAWL